MLLTLFLGRVYCSAICPLGIFQDAISRITHLNKRARFSYRKPIKILRYAFLAVFVLSFLLHASIVVSLLEPYSAFGRIISLIFGPLYLLGNNLLAYFAERLDSYAFYSVDIWLRSGAALAVSVLAFAVIIAFAHRSGRGYCNNICPIGAFLGLLAKYSFIKPRISHSKCAHCGLCAKNCKASCIDASEEKIDYSRCVACFNCIDVCQRKAISYAPMARRSLPSISQSKAPENLSNAGQARRNLISASTLAVLGGAIELHAHRPADGGLAELASKQAPNRKTPIIPPGSRAIRYLQRHCSACQLCISVCPNQVLRPSSEAASFMQPRMSFERGYCRPECVKCSEVCPTGAISKITAAEKSSIQIGFAVWDKELCIVNADKVPCGNCSRHCPTKAISMIPKTADDPASPQIPMIDTERCIGCGACEQLCPARPKSAIHVEGVEVHMGI
jgi:ferredoxin